jgi:hypothetical protein
MPDGESIGGPIPRVCVNCGKEFKRRGRGTMCEDCKPATSSETKKPRGLTAMQVEKERDIDYAVDFFAESLLSAGTMLTAANKHDGAVIINAAGVLPEELRQVMLNDSNIAGPLVNIARKGSIYLLGLTILGTVAVPIMANHGLIVPRGMAMDPDYVEFVIQQTARRAAQAAHEARGRATARDVEPAEVTPIVRVPQTAPEPSGWSSMAEGLNLPFIDEPVMA